MPNGIRAPPVCSNGRTMDGLAGTKAYLGLVPTDDPLRWQLPLRRELMTGGAFLYGGAGLAAAIAAMELSTGRPA